MLLNAPSASSETAAQPLSPRTKALIDIQTYEGSFEPRLALAALFGISMSDLEVNPAMCLASGGGNLTSIQLRKMINQVT